MLGIRTYIIGGLSLLLLATGLGIMWYVKSLQADNASLIENSKALQIAYDSYQARLYALRERVELQSVANEKLSKALAKARQPAKQSEKLFSNHNLEKLAKQRPGLIQSRARAATVDIYKQLEDATK